MTDNSTLITSPQKGKTKAGPSRLAIAKIKQYARIYVAMPGGIAPGIVLN